MKILIGADIVPTKTNAEHFVNARLDEIIDEKILELFRSADYRIFNSEVPLCDEAAPIEKCGPTLKAPAKSAEGFKQLGIDFCTLANNHILDHGEQGLKSTADALKNANIAYSGIGDNARDAAKPHVFTLGDKKIGVYCCTEHEFSVATEKTAGANAFDAFESLDHVAALKVECDYVICLYHGGKEHYRYPTPYLQKVCRKLVNKGADLVVCQHSHCIGCMEEYEGATIVYGQGNFLFDMADDEFWSSSLLVLLDTDSGAVKYIALSKDANGVRLAQDGEADEILAGFLARSEEIKQEGFVERRFAEEANRRESYYMRKFRGNSFFDKAMIKVFPSLYRKMFYSKKARLGMLNCIECEPHRDIITHILKK